MGNPIQDAVADDYIKNAQSSRINTDLFVLKSLQAHYPNHEISMVLENACNILEFAKTGQAIAYPDPDYNGTAYGPLELYNYAPPSSRLEASPGTVNNKVLFGRYIVTWNNFEFKMYVVDGRDSDAGYIQTRTQFIIPTNASDAKALVLAAGLYGSQLHEEIFVYDQGYWLKDAGLWKSIQKSVWENVILDENMKQNLIDDIDNFYDNRSTYDRLGVPWKRGLIFHGPPGNGKTISIKATMHMLYDRVDPVPTLYVKSLANWGGPESSLNDIFSKARAYAPCFLVFEDLDSIVSDDVRSFFLNQVDGLANNDGILMIGSTNHLERLDPGISKRPSRFDRKYLFPNPSFDQRVQYAEFWRHKVLKNNEKIVEQGDDEVEFPEDMCKAVAGITDKFSFAYMQEAFLAALLQIAIGAKSGHGGSTSPSTGYFFVQNEASDPADATGTDVSEVKDEDELDKFILWRKFKDQVKILRDQLGTEDDIKRSAVTSGKVQMRTMRARPAVQPR
jgi:transitional endoplasmic reticulum ATPase